MEVVYLLYATTKTNRSKEWKERCIGFSVDLEKRYIVPRDVLWKALAKNRVQIAFL
jgi:hypothetical protein